MLPNGFNVYPEDIENALRIAGLRDAVVVETRARADRGDRPSSAASGRGEPTRAGAHRRPRDRWTRVKAANARLGPNQRIAGWRLWPGEDFPRTHTLKIKRDPIRALGGRRMPPCRSPTGVRVRADGSGRDRDARPERLERGLRSPASSGSSAATPGPT